MQQASHAWVLDGLIQSISEIKSVFMGVEVNDGVIAGDVHYTTVTNSHAVMEKKEDVKLSWWGVMVTRNQYFLTYYISMTLVGFLIGLMWGVSKASEESFMEELGPIWAIVFFGSIIFWSIEAIIMNRRFKDAENNG